MKTADSIALSYQTIKSNRLRTVITVVIIALGIMALIAIITAVQAVNQSLTTSFSTMGANAFSLRYKERTIRMGGPNRDDVKVTTRNSLKEKVSSSGRLISYEEAKAFKDQFDFPAKVGISIPGPQGIIVDNGVKRTNPDIRILGGDENYLYINGYEIEYGRNFSAGDIASGENVCIIGNVVANKLYNDNAQKAMDQMIAVDNNKYRVIGILKDKGSSAFLNADKVVLTTVNNIRRTYGAGTNSYSIAVIVNDLNLMDVAVGEATGTFRPIRKLDIKEADNFYIDKSDSIVASLMANLGFLKYATLAIALITLIGAAIGLMNIMRSFSFLCEFCINIRGTVMSQ